MAVAETGSLAVGGGAGGNGTDYMATTGTYNGQSAGPGGGGGCQAAAAILAAARQWWNYGAGSGSNGANGIGSPGANGLIVITWTS